MVNGYGLGLLAIGRLLFTVYRLLVKGQEIREFRLIRWRVKELASLTFVTTRPIKQACWRSLLRKFKSSRVKMLSVVHSTFKLLNP